MLTERVNQGVVHSYESSAIYDPIGEPARKALHAALNLSAAERAYIKQYVKVRYNLSLNM